MVISSPTWLPGIFQVAAAPWWPYLETRDTWEWSEPTGPGPLVHVDDVELPDLDDVPVIRQPPPGAPVPPTAPPGPPGGPACPTGMIRPDMQAIESSLEWYCVKCRQKADRPPSRKTPSTCCGAPIGYRKNQSEERPPND